ncbi:hypothetical protein BG006_003482 [Podila minutissima]|uniref:Response regulatory domain-containing protein n=1 Tax=Podila minutissima TaxID=64525 RepID=A0A9P5S8L9_9FUNG|nr:hypothetical protein BG006_003482 [Podila minutissima]
MGLGNGHGTGTAVSVNGGGTVVSPDEAESGQVKSMATKKNTTPSQLFKKRKSGRGPVTLKRHVVPGSSLATPETSSSSSSSGSGSGSSGTGSSFQVCRMIKPVRRLKLLQIMYNALMHQQQGLEEARLEEIVEDGDDMSSKRARSISPATGVSTYSVSSSLKRPLEEEEGPMRRDGEDVNVKSSPENEEVTTTADRNDPPKRARNNDALTLLLTQEELERCRGINVLVAEDDFVSQKILEKQLSKLGMNVVIANNGQQAVNQWLAVDRGFYTIAIFDHHMPIMDGLAATKKIRALEAGFAEEMRKQSPEAENQTDNEMPHGGADSVMQRIPISCIRAGMDEYMTKPLLTKGLALLIQRYCCR